MSRQQQDALRWHALNALAVSLSERGQLVTQIHHVGRAPEQWDHCGQQAQIHHFADDDLVVTSDGEQHRP